MAMKEYNREINATIPVTGYRYPLAEKSIDDNPPWVAFRVPRDVLQLPTPIADPLPQTLLFVIFSAVVVAVTLTAENDGQSVLRLGPDGQIERLMFPGLPPRSADTRRYYFSTGTWTCDAVDDLITVTIDRLRDDLQQEYDIRLACAAAEERRRLEEDRQAAATLAAQRRAELDALRDEAWLANPDKLADLINRHAASPPFIAEAIERHYRDLLANQDDHHMRLDVHQLQGDARYLLLPAVVNIKAGGRFPHFDFERSQTTPSSLVFIQSHAALDLDAWKRSQDQINRYLGGRWIIEALDGTSVKLTKSPDLPTLIPFNPRYLRDGHVFMGINMRDGEPFYVPLAKLSHVLIGGQSGAGKSVMLNQVMRSLLYNLNQIDDITLVDLKRVELARYRNLSPKIKLVTNYTDLPDLMQSFVDDMERRYDAMTESGQVACRSNFRFLIIDEFASIQQRPLGTADEKKRHAALITNLNLLSQLSRAAGIKIWAQLQKPTADNMDTSFRTNLQSVGSFFMPAKVNAAAMFGEIDGLPADPTKLRKGEFVFRDDASGETVLLKSTYCDETDTAGLTAAIRRVA